METIKTIRLPVTISIAAYVLTTMLGAALLPFQLGRDQAAAFMGYVPPILEGSTLGSATYWFLLLLYPVVLPVGAMIGARVLGAHRSLVIPPPPLWLPLALVAAMIVFCAYRLALNNGLDVSIAWNRSVCYDAKMVRRSALLQGLGNPFFFVAFAGLPALTCYLLARGIKQRERAGLAAFAVALAALLYLDLATLQKAPLMVLALMLLLTLILSGWGIVRSCAVVIPAAGLLFIGLSFSQFCTQPAAQWAPGTTTGQAAPQSKPFQTAQVLRDLPLQTARSFVFRMAIGFPYYVETFEDPAERCGIERSFLARIVGPQHCSPPQKIFSRVYPSINYAVGYQPAPVSVSAYAEAGPWYALLATLGVGVLIGLIARLASTRDPISITLLVATCVFGYYAAQASLTGALLDSYGIVWLVLPIAAMVAASAAIRRRSVTATLRST